MAMPENGATGGRLIMFFSVRPFPGIEAALYDLVGKIYGCPVYQLLDGKIRRILVRRKIQLNPAPGRLRNMRLNHVDLGVNGAMVARPNAVFWTVDFDTTFAQARPVLVISRRTEKNIINPP